MSTRSSLKNKIKLHTSDLVDEEEEEGVAGEDAIAVIAFKRASSFACSRSVTSNGQPGFMYGNPNV